MRTDDYSYIKKLLEDKRPWWSEVPPKKNKSGFVSLFKLWETKINWFKTEEASREG